MRIISRPIPNDGVEVREFSFKWTGVPVPLQLTRS
jgi:hypothetical protein